MNADAYGVHSFPSLTTHTFLDIKHLHRRTKPTISDSH